MASSVDTSRICAQHALSVIPFQKYSGLQNMALDFILSRSISTADNPILRFYGWQPACLSLGHHQQTGEVDFQKLFQDGCHIVRRPTGGSAILHDRELTYSLIVPGGQKEHHKIYSDFHGLLAAALQRLGYPVELHQQQMQDNYLRKSQKTFACFNRPAFAEIKYKNKKLVGSAQKLFSNSLLQHGSIMISSEQERVLKYLEMNATERQERSNELRHGSTGLAEIHSRPIDENSLSEAIIQEFAESGVKSIYFRQHTAAELKEAAGCSPLFSVSSNPEKQETI